jgi:hypothetical protein
MYSEKISGVSTNFQADIVRLIPGLRRRPSPQNRAHHTGDIALQLMARSNLDWKFLWHSNGYWLDGPAPGDDAP